MHSIVKSRVDDEQLAYAFKVVSMFRVLVGMRRLRNAALLAGVSASAFVASPVWANPATSANTANFSQITAGAVSQNVPDGVCAVAVIVRGGAGASSGTTAALGGIGAGGATFS